MSVSDLPEKLGKPAGQAPTGRGLTRQDQYPT
ncbi:hypothetical protein BJ987_001795 [Nocardia goodfellowii]|uniref:Uncharacterized protein n=1 Tax=Nocardia goodfellowii TaxID=882446 RepID=A0ABS4QB15_9NOCA|nr:hypothetical protein [Nocardia goodfellowii]